MIGLVIVTHGNLALEFKSAMEHVVGVQENVETICIGPDDDMEKRRADITEAANRADSGQGVILLTDMFGGTPSNLAISLLDQGKVEVIAGINLPMLIKLAGVREKLSMEDCVATASDAARKYISVASQVLNKKEGNASAGQED
ncbi:MAG: PTS sugar transporter subunit IIA [Parvibaculales bacterium]